MGCCYIVGAGEFCETELPTSKDDLIIAADGGYVHLANIGITPDICVGDFDSAPKPCNIPEIVTFKCEKDDTDMLIAVKRGLEVGFSEFKIYGGCGGRADHTIANIQTLHYIAKNGGTGQLIGNNAVYTVISSALSFPSFASGKISVFSLSDRSEGVCERGLKYELEDAVLTSCFPLGVSNEFIGKKSEITVKNGYLLVVTERFG